MGIAKHLQASQLGTFLDPPFFEVATVALRNLGENGRVLTPAYALFGEIDQQLGSNSQNLYGQISPAQRSLIFSDTMRSLEGVGWVEFVRPGLLYID